MQHTLGAQSTSHIRVCGQGICYKATLGVDPRMKKGSHVGRRFLLATWTLRYEIRSTV